MNIKFKGLGFFSVIILVFLFLPHLVSARVACQCDISCDTSVYRETAGTISFVKEDETNASISTCTSFANTLSDSEAQAAKNLCSNFASLSTAQINSVLKTQNCRPDEAANQKIIDDAEKAKEIKSIEAAGDAISDLTNWTCILTYEGEAPGLNRGVSATKINVDKICVDYKNLASTMAVDRDAARQLCYQNCDAGATQDANRAKGCLFVLTQTCSQYASNPSASGSGYDGPDFSDLSNELGATARGLNKLGLSSPSALIGRLIRVAVGIIGTIALVIFVYAGLIWMTSRGDSSKAESSRSMLLWASLGVVVILSSYAIVDFIFGTVFK